MNLSYFEYIQLIQIIQYLRCGEVKLQQEINNLQTQINNISATGSTFVGMWQSTATYAANVTVVYGDYVYKALKSSTDVTPGTDSATWLKVGIFEINGGNFTKLYENFLKEKGE